MRISRGVVERKGSATQVCAGAKGGSPATPEAMLTRVRRFGRAWSGNFVRLQALVFTLPRHFHRAACTLSHTNRVTWFGDPSHGPQTQARNPINSTQRACLMSDNIENCNARLEKLVRRIMKEKDPVEFDELCSVLWLVLKEREGLAGVEGSVDGANKTARVIPSRIPTLRSRFFMTQEGMHHQYRVTAWWTSGCYRTRQVGYRAERHSLYRSCPVWRCRRPLDS